MNRLLLQSLLALFLPAGVWAQAPTITKLFGQSPILVGQTTPLTFTITNTDMGPGVGNIGFTDTLPAGLVLAMPNGLSGGCGIGTVTAVAGSNMISLAGGALP